MSQTVIKGDLGRSHVIHEAMKRGYTVSLPMTENSRYDLILDRNNKLERIQVKWTKSKGDVITVLCRTSNKWSRRKYTRDEIDAIICYDDYTGKTYYLPASMLGAGKATVRLRLVEARCTQKCHINWAKDFENW